MNWDKYYKMEHYKMSYIKQSLWQISKFVTWKWIEINDLSGDQYSPMLR